MLLKAHYDDGGISGGTLERPALQRLMADVDADMIDQIVVYKIDRLTRSLPDFAKLVDRLDAAQASFVSVTQAFNTATSMGRLTLNVLLSFAQFEREVTADRIRDKIAASKKKGLWMGGYVPLGYDKAGRTLVINEGEAQTVRKVFALYEEHRALNRVAGEAARLGLRSKRYTTQSGRCPGGNVMSRGHIHKILTNPLYAGRIAHKGQTYDGQHPAIIAPERWERVQAILVEHSAIRRGDRTSGRPRSPLAGKLFDAAGEPLSAVHTKKAGKRHDYFLSKSLENGPAPRDKEAGWRLPARKLEATVVLAIRNHLASKIPRGLLREADAHTIRRSLDRLAQGDFDCLGLIRTVRIGDGRLEITMDRTRLSLAFDVPVAIIPEDHLRIGPAFTMRRRGAETRMLLDGDAAPRDEALLRNITLGQAFLDKLEEGRNAREIGYENELSTKRVQQILEFAFLSPEIVRKVVEGRQPGLLTSDWCLTHEIPISWTEQARFFSLS